MPSRPLNTEIMVIADDFTGANDAGVGLLRQGARVTVLFSDDAIIADKRVDAWVVSTDSRALGPVEAARRVTQALSRWRAAAPAGWVYKKVDSTLRGNLGAEIEAALTSSDAPMAIIAPAAPAMGRVIRDGQCEVHGRLLIDTEFASDPKTPITTSSVADRIGQQCGLPLAHLPLALVRGGELASHLIGLQQQGYRLVVLDSAEDADLARIAESVAQLPFQPLLVGSAGLMEHWAQRLAFTPIPPLLAIVGSMSETARRQIDYALEHGNLQRIDIDALRLFDQDADQLLEQWAREIGAVLQAGRHCVVRTSQDANQRQGIEDFCQRRDMSRQALGDAICQRLGSLTRRVIDRQPVGGLYLTGGDVAIAVAAALDARGFEIQGQIAACVPYGRLLASRVENIPVMTKAGGFGTETTLLDVIRFVEERPRD